MYIGDGAKLVRDAFDLAKEKILKEGRKVTREKRIDFRTSKSYMPTDREMICGLTTNRC